MTDSLTAGRQFNIAGNPRRDVFGLLLNYKILIFITVLLKAGNKNSFRNFYYPQDFPQLSIYLARSESFRRMQIFSNCFKEINAILVEIFKFYENTTHFYYYYFRILF